MKNCSKKLNSMYVWKQNELLSGKSPGDAWHILALPLVYKCSGPVHTNAFSKTSVFCFLKTDKKFFVHTSVFVAFSTIHTTPPKTDKKTSVLLSLLSHANASDVIVFENLRFRLSTQRRWTSVFTRPHKDAEPPFSKTSTLESVFENLRFRRHTPPFSIVLVWTEGENG